MPKRKSKKKIPMLVVIIVIFAGLVSYGIWHHYHKSILGKNIATHSSPADNDFNNTRKSSSNPAQTLDNGPTANAQSSSSSSNINVTVTRASIFDSSLEVGTIVSGASSGTCALNVSQAGQQTITQSNSLTLSNNSYMCPVFKIPLSQFPNQNDWNVSVTVSGSATSGTGTWANNPVNLSAGTI